MRVFLSCLLVVVLAMLFIVGLLRVLKDLLSRNIFDAPSSPNEEQVVGRAEWPPHHE